MHKKILAPQVISLDSIQAALQKIDVYDAIAQGFIAYSKGKAVIPPVGELLFDQPPGDVHIKYGYLKSEPYYVIKIASGFYDNPLKGLPSSQGLNLLFDKSNGELRVILLDEGHLTDIRTAVAGAIATQALVNSAPKRIGIVGAGIQACLQLEYHQKIMNFAEVLIWNRNLENAQKLARKASQDNCPIKVISDLKELCHKCQVIVTTTPSTAFLIKEEWIQPGTHITAIGSDTSEKIELESSLLERADIVVVDSLSQSKTRGEVFRAAQLGLLKGKELIELGSLLQDISLGRSNDQQITIADLTGVAVQDLMISQAVFENLL